MIGVKKEFKIVMTLFNKREKPNKIIEKTVDNFLAVYLLKIWLISVIANPLQLRMQSHSYTWAPHPILPFCTFLNMSSFLTHSVTLTLRKPRSNHC